MLTEKLQLKIEIEEYRKAAIKMAEPEHRYREEIADQESYIDDCEEQIELLSEELAERIQEIK